AAGRAATAAAESRAGASAASALLSDAQRHRPRRTSLHPAPRRSQRRLTPFFSSLLMKEMIRRYLRQKSGSIGIVIALAVFALLGASQAAATGQAESLESGGFFAL